jgi:hypothetical protein
VRLCDWAIFKRLSKYLRKVNGCTPPASQHGNECGRDNGNNFQAKAIL